MYLVLLAVPSSLGAAVLRPLMVAREGAVWQLVTYLFLHGGPLHLLFNMLMLFLFGSPVEREIGSSEFLTLYLTCGVLAGVFSTILAVASAAPVAIVGASGAVYGIMLAYAVLNPYQVVTFWFIPMRATTMVLILGGLALVFQITGQRTHVAHLTHLGGLLAGFLYLRVRLGIDPLEAFRRG
ncbi:MAG: rhomboid family intramembrane serine protease [Spirochaetaceae bacterium]|nr:rhomboid family intramembrane serine protease [Spirochaetaceae bacterium]